MEQAISRMSRRAGWSDYENRLLWETADEAQQQGLPLKAVFEKISERTGRRPNSIRNYYYAQVRGREDGQEHAARFVPFTQDEVDKLMESVLRARAQGQSVRACLQEISGGDHSLMLRYQNKYRSVIKTRPDYVCGIVEKLNEQGVECDAPKVNHRPRADMKTACGALMDESRMQGDAELAKAIDVLARHLTGRRESERAAEILAAADAMTACAREYADKPLGERASTAAEFSAELTARSEALKQLLNAN